MPYENAVTRERSIMQTRPPEPEDFSFGDAFTAAGEDAMRTMPTNLLINAAKNVFDSSERITASQANIQYNLQGEAAFKEGEEVTVSMAADRAEDQSQLIINNHIQGMYAEKSPTGSIVANITGSLAYGFIDPTLLAINVGTGFAATAGLQAIATGTRVGRAGVNLLGRYSPTAGRAFIQMYNTKAAQNLTTVALREGLENFAASAIEEGIVLAGVGEDRLARKVSLQESLRNVVIGTTIGTGFGVILDKNGRRGIMNRFNRMYGDKAAEIVDSQNKTLTFNFKGGFTQENYDKVALNQEIFLPKPWHSQRADATDYALNPQDGRFYITLSEVPARVEDRPSGLFQMQSVSNRDKMVSITSNVTQAQNLGTHVRELNIRDTNILTPDNFKGKIRQDAIKKIVKDFVEDIDAVQANNAISKLIGDVDHGKSSPKLLSRLIKEELKDKESIEDILQTLESVSASGGIDYDVHRILQNVLDNYGYDGYTYRGKNYLDQDAYTGIALTEKGALKLKKQNEFEVTRARDFVEEETYRLAREEDLKNYALNIIKNTRKAEEQASDAAIIDQDKPVPNIEQTQKPAKEAQTFYQDDDIYKQSVDRAIERLEEIKKTKGLNIQEELELSRLSLVKNNTDLEKFADEKILPALDKFEECIKG